MKKILFVAPHRKDRSPSQRFRFEQYFEFLTQQGYECELSYLISEKDDKVFYSSGNFIQKLLILFKQINKRLRDIKRASKYDIVFVQREAFFTGTTYFERKLKEKCGKLIFDFDDAIWNHDVSSANKTLGWLKNPAKTSKIIGLCDLVIAGNEYLADYAKKYNQNVIIIPTTINTEEYKPVNGSVSDDQICIGWSGSITTIKHFEYALPFLKILKEKYGNKISINVIGDASYRNKELDIVGIAWNKKYELRDLSKFDIGIMPLPDDPWAKGKCGLKGLQYMALSIPTVMSPVGVNMDIIKEGTNGYLADSVDEWVEKISKLIDNQKLREDLGNAARQTVIDHYSVDSQKETYLNALNKLIC